MERIVRHIIAWALILIPGYFLITVQYPSALPFTAWIVGVLCAIGLLDDEGLALHLFREPCPSDFETEEEYEKAHDAWENWNDEKEDRIRERRLREKE